MAELYLAMCPDCPTKPALLLVLYPGTNAPAGLCPECHSSYPALGIPSDMLWSVDVAPTTTNKTAELARELEKPAKTENPKYRAWVGGELDDQIDG